MDVYGLFKDGRTEPASTLRFAGHQWERLCWSWTVHFWYLLLSFLYQRLQTDLGVEGRWWPQELGVSRALCAVLGATSLFCAGCWPKWDRWQGAGRCQEENACQNLQGQGSAFEMVEEIIYHWEKDFEGLIFLNTYFEFWLFLKKTHELSWNRETQTSVWL